MQRKNLYRLRILYLNKVHINRHKHKIKNWNKTERSKVLPMIRKNMYKSEIFTKAYKDISATFSEIHYETTPNSELEILLRDHSGQWNRKMLEGET